MLEKLKEDVCRANQSLGSYGLSLFNSGNISAIDRETGYMVIKPAGIPYAALTPEQMVVVNENGIVMEGTLSPVTETPAHLEMYHCFSHISAIVHTHSHYATCFAQAKRAIPVYGITHSEFFCGEIPCTRELTPHECSVHYEKHMGQVVQDTFRYHDEREIPGVLVARHGVFTWGKSLARAVRNAVALEEIARMAYDSELLCTDITPMEQNIVERRFYRRHGHSSGRRHSHG